MIRNRQLVSHNKDMHIAVTTKSISECLHHCQNCEECLSLTYSGHSSQCSLHDATYAHTGFNLTSQTDTEYWQLHCDGI